MDETDLPPQNERVWNGWTMRIAVLCLCRYLSLTLMLEVLPVDLFFFNTLLRRHDKRGIGWLFCLSGIYFSFSCLLSCFPSCYPSCYPSCRLSCFPSLCLRKCWGSWLNRRRHPWYRLQLRHPPSDREPCHLSHTFYHRTIRPFPSCVSVHLRQQNLPCARPWLHLDQPVTA